MKPEPKKIILKCPVCGLEMDAQHGWAFASTANTVCRPGEVSIYAHPFKVKK